MLNTLKMLINIGKYKGDICYIYGNDMKNEQNLLNNPILKDNKIILKYFPDLNFGIEIRFNPNFIGHTVLSVNNYQENVEMWKTHFNYERSYIKLDGDYFSVVAFDNIGLITFDEPLPVLGDIGLNGYDFGFDFSGVYFETSNQFKSLIFDIITVDVSGELVYSDKSGYDEEDISAMRFHFSKDIRDNKIISLGTSKYNYTISIVSYQVVAKYRYVDSNLKFPCIKISVESISVFKAIIISSTYSLDYYIIICNRG